MCLRKYSIIWTVISLHAIITASEACDDIDVTRYVVEDAKLGGHVISRFRSEDVLECARTCVKRRQCVSINFDSTRRTCELSDHKTENQLGLTAASGYQYSDISVWPNQIEPNCYSKPCADNEVCVPGPLVQTGSQTPGCSYSCFKLDPVVPYVPETSNPNDFEVQLVNDGTYPTVIPPNMVGGRLELFYGGKWRPVVLNSAYGWRETQVVCRQLGHSEIETVTCSHDAIRRENLIRFGGTYHKSSDRILPGILSDRISFRDLDCDGDETGLAQCRGVSTVAFDSGNSGNSIGIACYESHVNSSQTVSLKANGRVQFTYNGVTSVVNGIEQAGADVVCKTINGAHSIATVLPITNRPLEGCWIRNLACSAVDPPPHPFFCKNGVWLNGQTCLKVSAIRCT